MVGPTVRFYVLTEDAGAQAHATWAALLRRMCRIVDPSCQTQREVFALEEPEKQVRETMVANAWRSRSKLDHLKRVHFWRTIADRLEEAMVVAFHVDGDEVWSPRWEQSQNVRDVREIALRRVRDALEHRGRGAAEVDALLANFIPLHPFVEIESWLFHNVAAVRRIHERKGATPPSCVDAWEARPELLDAVRDPKEALPRCTGHNRDLAEDAFPAELVYLLESSFYVAVEALRACASLVDALRRTYAVDRWRRGE